MAEVRVKVFTKDLQKNLYPTNAFYKKSRKDGASNAQTIEIPQSAAQVKAVIGNIQQGYDDVANNLSEADKLTAVKRINTKKSYDNQNFYVPPVVLDKNNQDGELSYEKQSELRDDFSEELNTKVANYAAVKWAPSLASNIVLTTGTETRAGLVTGGLGGSVKRTRFQDLLTISKMAKRMNLSNGGKWHALPTPEFWEDIMLLEEFRTFEKTGSQTLLKTGEIGKWLGITWMDARHNEDLNANIIYDTSGAVPTKVDYEAATVGGKETQILIPTATSVGGVLFWNEKLVRRSEGRVNSYFRKKDPEYQGDILSANSRFGATISRADERGVLALVETPDA